MAFLIVGDERVALQVGDNVLGGTGEDAVDAAGLAPLGPFATISVFLEVVATMRRVAGQSVVVDGAAVGDGPLELRHGSRIESQGVSMVFGDLRSLGSTSRIASVTDDVLEFLVGEDEGNVTGDSGGVLHAMAGGRSYVVPREGLTIGRDPSCGVVLASRDVSRIHASIAPSLRGYTITERGINGVIVNGGRVDGSRLLRGGDTIRVGDEEFRFEADASSYAPSPDLARTPGARSGSVFRPPVRAGEAPGLETAEADSPRQAGSALDRPATASPQGAPARRLMATLEVITEGVLRGTRFRIERALAHIGRGDHNDVLLADASVSGSHATLLHRGGAWHLSDLGSTNGTYLDGTRLHDEQIVRGAAEIRVGDVKMVFRPIEAPGEPSTTRAIIGVSGKRGKAGRREER